MNGLSNFTSVGASVLTYLLFLEFWLILTFGLVGGPLMMVLILVFVLLGLALVLANWLANYLFSYLVFLLFMSGLIMMLMYLCSVVLNEKMVIFQDFYSLLLVLLIMVKSYNFDMHNSSVAELSNLKILHWELGNLMKYLIAPYWMFFLFFVSYLLFCLIIVYEIVKRCSGPLRMKS